MGGKNQNISLRSLLIITMTGWTAILLFEQAAHFRPDIFSFLFKVIEKVSVADPSVLTR